MIRKPLAYFDSSVAIKRYLHEAGSGTTSQLIRQYRIVSSRLTPVEIKSVIGRRHTGGDLVDKAYDAVIRKLTTDLMKWQIIALSPGIMDSAEELVQSYNVRTLDAIHIASALAFNAQMRGKIPFITADLRQRDAAMQAGLKIITVE